MQFPRFITFTSLACALYISVFSLAGYFLGRRFPIIKDYIVYLLPVSIAVAILIIYLQARKHKNSHQQS
jgi:membrane-associated protein